MPVVKVPGHGNYKLSLAPAQSIERIDAQRKAQGRGPLPITSAFRGPAEQLALIARWLRGGTYNRPPYLYKPAMYPPYPHSTGRVIDTSDRAWMLKYGKAHGWRQPFAYDVVHFEYHADLDTKKPAKVKPTDTRKVYYALDTRTYYLAGLVDGKPYLNKTRQTWTRDRWKRKWGTGNPYHLSYAQIKAKAGLA